MAAVLLRRDRVLRGPFPGFEIRVLGAWGEGRSGQFRVGKVQQELGKDVGKRADDAGQTVRIPSCQIEPLR